MKNFAAVMPKLIMIQIVLCGCTAPVSVDDQVGFLSDYSRLERIDDSMLRFVDDSISEYSTFIIDPVVIAFRKAPEERIFTDEELRKVSDYYDKQVMAAMSENSGYAIVEDPAPGVARIRIGITDVEETIGYLNVAIFTKLSGLGLGGASIEGEIIDSVTGKQLGAVIRWSTGSRILKAGITETGDAKIAIDSWSKDLRRQIDEAHGR